MTNSKHMYRCIIPYHYCSTWNLRSEKSRANKTCMNVSSYIYPPIIYFNGHANFKSERNTPKDYLRGANPRYHHVNLRMIGDWTIFLRHGGSRLPIKTIICQVIGPPAHEATMTISTLELLFFVIIIVVLDIVEFFFLF